MIINRSHNFIFIHVPKTAGTSVANYLAQFTQVGDVELGGTDMGELVQHLYFKRFGLRKHSTAVEVRNYFGSFGYSSFFRFAFVRNPYARAYSLYRYLATWRTGPNNKAIAKLSFDQFLKSDYFTKHREDLTRPQVHWTHDPIRQEPAVDYIGRLEALDEAMSMILTIINRRPTTPGSIERLNATAEADEWVRTLTPNSRATIREIYSIDFETFGYEP
jgi:hypothetical protein